MSDPVPFARGGACPPPVGGTRSGRSFAAAAMMTRTAS